MNKIYKVDTEGHPHFMIEVSEATVGERGISLSLRLMGKQALSYLVLISTGEITPKYQTEVTPDSNSEVIDAVFQPTRTVTGRIKEKPEDRGHVTLVASGKCRLSEQEPADAVLTIPYPYHPSYPPELVVIDPEEGLTLPS